MRERECERVSQRVRKRGNTDMEYEYVQVIRNIFCEYKFRMFWHVALVT